MRMIELTELLDQGERHARRILLERREKQLTAFYHLVAPRGPDRIVVCTWRNDIDKQLAVFQIKALSREMGAVAAMFISESWMLSVPVGDPIPIDPPAQDARRQEVVMMLATDGRETRARSLQIKRDKPGGRIVDLVADETTRLGGKFAGRLIDGIIEVRGDA
jgi:hypothetical protein